MLAIYKKEVRSYIYSMTGSVMMAVFLAFVGFFTTQVNIAYGYSALEYTLGFLVVYCIIIIIVPFVTMRSIAEERHSRTEQLLFSLPIPMYKIVVAKYLAQLTIFAVPMLITAIYPLLLSLFGEVNFAATYSVWLVLFLLIAAMVAMGMFISSLVESQIIAAIITAGVFFLLYFMSNITASLSTAAMTSLIAFSVMFILFGCVVFLLTKNGPAAMVSALLPIVVSLIFYIITPDSFSGLFAVVIDKLAIFDRFVEVVSYRSLDITAIVYFITVSVVFVFMTVQSVERRRWN